MAPSERITMGFIGVGGQGTGHLLGGAWTYLTGGYTARKDSRCWPPAMSGANVAR